MGGILGMIKRLALDAPACEAAGEQSKKTKEVDYGRAKMEKSALHAISEKTFQMRNS